MPHRIELPPALRDGAFTLDDLRSEGLSRGRLRRADVAHPFHGVHAHGLDGLVLEDRCRAILPAMGPHHSFAHVTAARLWGMPLPGFRATLEALHVMAVGDRGRVRRPGIIGWETEDPAVERRALGGLPVIGPADTWAHLSATSRSRGIPSISREWLTAIGDFLISGARTDAGRTPALCTRRDLVAAAIRRRGKRGAKALTLALADVRTGVDSPKESLLRLGLVAAGLPEPEIQLEVLTAAGPRHADLGYRAARLLLEFQGDEHRSSRRRWLRDLTRIQLFEDAGYRVIAVGDHDIAPECAALARRVHRALASRPFTP